MTGVYCHCERSAAICLKGVVCVQQITSSFVLVMTGVCYFVLRPRNDGSVLLRLGSISNSRSLHHCLALLRQCAVCYMVLSTARVYHFLCQVNINFTCVRISPYFCFYAAFMALHSFLCKRARP